MRTFILILVATFVAGIGTVALAAPPPSPGLPMGQTLWDEQQIHSSGHQTARTPGAGIVHFVWTASYNPEYPTHRLYAYEAVELPSHTLLQGFGGMSYCFICLGCNCTTQDYANTSVDSGNTCQIAYVTRQDPIFPRHSWRDVLPIVGSVLSVGDELPNMPPLCSELICPRVAASHDPGHTVVHELSREEVGCGANRLAYWRYSDSGWAGPVVIDSSPTLGHIVVDDPTSEKTAIIFHSGDLHSIAYYESQTSGAGWIDGMELGTAFKHTITNYSDPNGPSGFVHIAAAYDNSGVLHIVWDEQQRPGSDDVIIRHWSSATQTIRPIAAANWPSPAKQGENSLSLSKISLGVGDGSTACGAGTDRDFLYVVYTRFGGYSPAERADSSALGFYNGELYLNVSKDGGSTWSPPSNLTNTKTPSCYPGLANPTTGIPEYPDSVCRSEHWASIGETVSDIDIIFISDLDAGAATQGEGTWQLNPVNYLHLAGGTTDAPFVCPTTGAALYVDDQIAALGTCGGQRTAPLAISNLGNATLAGQISVVYTNPASPPSFWLKVNGSQTLAYGIAAGATDLVHSVALVTGALPPGDYEAEIRITHNDATRPSPYVIPVSFGTLCRCHADPKCDGQSDVLDVIAVIQRAFRGEAALIDPSCPMSGITNDGMTDVDCSGATDVIDVVKMIDVAFRGAPASAKFCNPCGM